MDYSEYVSHISDVFISACVKNSTEVDFILMYLDSDRTACQGYQTR